MGDEAKDNACVLLDGLRRCCVPKCSGVGYFKAWEYEAAGGHREGYLCEAHYFDSLTQAEQRELVAQGFGE